MILGDLNRHMGDMIEGNDNDKISFGGQMIRDFSESDKYILVNATKKVIGGPFTSLNLLTQKMMLRNLFLVCVLFLVNSLNILRASQLTRTKTSPHTEPSVRTKRHSLTTIL